MSWQPRAARTMPSILRAFTSVTAMVLRLPKKRWARSRSRSPHQTVCPCRSRSCARREPVAPAPSTKMRMSWRKLYHKAVSARDSGPPGLQPLFPRRTLIVSPTSAACGTDSLWRPRRRPGGIDRERGFGWKRPGLPLRRAIFAKPWLGKERWAKKRTFSSAPDIQASGVGLLFFADSMSARF